MELHKIGILAIATSVLAGCAGGGSERQPILGRGATEAEANAAIDVLETEVFDVFLADGTTEYSALPSGSVTYTGLVYGASNGGSGPATDYAADLDLTVEFDTDGVNGRIYNFVTNITDFNNPAGTIDVTGDILDGTPDALISFSGDGVLTGTNGVTAEYSVSSDGQFGGTDGSVLIGSQITDFEWLTGPDTGNTSFSDGGFAATRD